MTDGDTLLGEALELLPPDVINVLRQVPLFVKDRPSPEDVALGVQPTARAVYFEVDPRHSDEDDERKPEGLIMVFTHNVNPCTPRNLADVLAHEAGHVCGLDEEQVKELGL